MNVANKVQQLHPFLNSAVILDISNGVFETAQTVASVACICEKSFVEKKWKAPALNAFAVLFDIESAEHKGQIIFYFTKKSLQELYMKIVGIKEEITLDENLLDCLGEVCNQAYGVAKTKLNRAGYAFIMTLPQPILTEELAVKESKYPAIVVPFKLFDERCYIQLVIL